MTRVDPSLHDRMRSDAQPDPAAGQMWRMELDRATALGVTLSADTGSVSIAPISENVDFAGPWTVVFDASPLGIPIAAWCDSIVDVPDLHAGTGFSGPSESTR